MKALSSEKARSKKASYHVLTFEYPVVVLSLAETRRVVSTYRVIERHVPRQYLGRDAANSFAVLHHWAEHQL
jgi:hypothetical protein